MDSQARLDARVDAETVISIAAEFAGKRQWRWNRLLKAAWMYRSALKESK